MSIQAGVLYVVATPVGNLTDISERARDVLAAADLVAAEDTRRTGRLLHHFGITRPLLSLHEHNEDARIGRVLDELGLGQRIALVSDAGTPLISDPGYRLVRAARAAGFRVSPIPGPCAAIAALSAAGLPTDRFAFEGFLPARAAARSRRLAELAHETRTLIFYEAGNRVQATLAALIDAFGPDRAATLARELTKLHETVTDGTLAELARVAAEDSDATRGEVVIVVAGAKSGHGSATSGISLAKLLHVLVSELPLKQAVRLASRATDAPRNEVYAMALKLRGDATDA